MQRFVMIAVGMLLLTASSARAEHLLVKQTESTWRGCIFRLSIYITASENPYYYATLESEVAKPDTCTLTPAVRYFDTSFTQPVMALAVNDLGMVVVNAYVTRGPIFEGWPALNISSVDRNTLESTTLVGLYLPFSVMPRPEEIEALSTTYLNALQPNADSVESVQGH